MTWEFDNARSATLDTAQGAGTANCYPSGGMVFDGRDVWISYSIGTSAHGINVFGYWDQQSNYEYLDDAYFKVAKEVRPLVTKNYIATSAKVRWLSKWGDTVYGNMAGSPGTIARWNVATKTAGTSINLPVAMQQKFLVAYGKIWCVASDVTATDQNVLYTYDLQTTTWSTQALAGRKQVPDGTKDGVHDRFNIDIVDGLDGAVWMTCQNDHTIRKFNGYTSVHENSYVINRHPYRMFVDTNKNIYVATDRSSIYQQVLNGTLIEFNPSTLSVSGFSSCNSVTDIGMTSDFVWFMGASLNVARLNRSTKSLIYKGGTSAGTTLATPNNYNGLHGIVTPQISYMKWNGSAVVNVTVSPYLFCVNNTDSNIVWAARLSPLARVNSYQVLGTCMVGTGDQTYYGES